MSVLSVNISESRKEQMKYTPKSSEEDLIQGCLKQNRLAQNYLYQRYFGKMLGICMRYTGNKEEAIEVLNMAFLKVFNNLHKYKPTGPFGGWVARIVFNTSIDFVRKQNSYRKVMDLNIEKELPINNEALDHLATEDLFKLIQKLPTPSRTVFSLYVIEGYKHKEIAKQLDISEGTSKWHLSNARKALQQLVEKYSRIGLRI